jgi:F-type H+-transporting ATPase subunit b
MNTTWKGRLLLAGSLVLLLGSTARAEQEADPTQSGSIYNALWALGIFAVLLVILGRYAWKPILKQMELREKQVADTIAAARAQQEESQKLLQAYQARLAAADEEAAKQMEKTRQAAEAARQEILAAARAEAGKVSARAREEIEQARKDALDDLYRFAADLATDAAGKILRRELKPEDQRRLVAESLELIRQRAANQ